MTKMKGRYTTEAFSIKMQEVNPNINILGEYRGIHENIECRCNICGNKWAPIPNNLLRGHGCPDCAKEKSKNSKRHTTELFKDRLQKANKNITVIGKYKNSKTGILCECNICGYQWNPTPNNLLKGSGCPACANNIRGSIESLIEKLETVNPSILVIDNSYVNSDTGVLCMCKVCGYQWKSTPYHLLSGHKCPTCTNRRKYTTQEFIDKLYRVNKDIIILDEYNGNKKKISCECRLCGHRWKAIPNNLLNGSGCPNCNHASTSFAEQFIFEALKQAFGKNEVTARNRKIIGKELDIYLPSYNYAVEFNGWYWHQNKIEKDKEKALKCKEKGIKILFIYDWCPQKTIPIDADCLIFSYDLGCEKGHPTLKNIVLEIIASIKQTTDVRKKTRQIDWDTVEKNAYLNSKRKTTEHFIEEMWSINKNIKILGSYVGYDKEINCECIRCGHRWTPTPHSLLSGKGCPACAKKLKKKKKHKDLEQLEKSSGS